MAQLVLAPDLTSIAGEVVASLTTHQQISPFSSRPDGFRLEDGHRVTPLLRAAFEARGETIIGRKVGFTNRKIWAQYGVYAPNWGYITDATTTELSSTSIARASDFAEPRIEPEIMFGLNSAPSPDMDETALLACIEWISLGYEIVQSIFPGWKFKPADSVAANAMHGALLIGRRHLIAPRKTDWVRELATFTVELYCDGTLSESGGGALVLDSPLLVLRHLLQLLAEDPYNPRLTAGEIISTGTLTIAVPVRAGETWTTKASGIPLDDISLTFR